jgi:outer membrane cobalamin receptor
MRKASANLLDDGRVARWLVLMFCLNGWSPVGGQQQPGDLASQSLEALMDVEVTSVSKKEQKVSRTASAVFVITQEDIRQSGATNIPDLLRGNGRSANYQQRLGGQRTRTQRAVRQRAIGDD